MNTRGLWLIGLLWCLSCCDRILGEKRVIQPSFGVNPSSIVVNQPSLVGLETPLTSNSEGETLHLDDSHKVDALTFQCVYILVACDPKWITFPNLFNLFNAYSKLIFTLTLWNIVTVRNLGITKPLKSNGPFGFVHVDPQKFESRRKKGYMKRKPGWYRKRQIRNVTKVRSLCIRVPIR